MAIERTFSIIKPDATARNLTGAVNAIIEKAGLRIVAQKRILMTRAQAETFYAVHKARPFFGICVGMQLMATQGKEYVTTPGLDWIAGDVEKIAPRDENLKIPHMGWNTLDLVREHPVLDRLPLGDKGRHAYFVHSYHLKAANENDVVARADYGGPVTAIVAKDTMIGTQFHPEKSQRFGLALISNFLKWKP